MKQKKGVLNKKLKTYYADVNLSNYKNILFEAMSKYQGNKFKKVLDIGSGVGSFPESIKNFDLEVFSLEASEYGYKTCISKGISCKKFLLLEGKELPFKDGTFSFVLMNQVLEHLDQDTGKYYISEIFRVLEDGGVGIIKSPSRYSIIWNTDPNHVYCWKPYELFDEISKYTKSSKNIQLDRVPLEPWMMVKYNEEVINTWHKYNKYPLVKKFFYMFMKVLDKLVFKPMKSDRILATSNVTFVKS